MGLRLWSQPLNVPAIATTFAWGICNENSTGLPAFSSAFTEGFWTADFSGAGFSAADFSGAGFSLVRLEALERGVVAGPGCVYLACIVRFSPVLNLILLRG